MNFARVLFLSACLVPCAACSDKSPSSSARLASASSAVLGGTEDANDEAVIAVTLAEATNVGVGFCTGTLIAPNLVLTARHCVSDMVDNDAAGVQCDARTVDGKTVAPDKNGALVSERSILLFNVAKVGSGSTAGPAVKAVRVPPDAMDSANCGHDIAVLELERPWTGVAPIAPRLDAPPQVHEALTIVGYGNDGAKPNSDGVRRVRTGAKVSSIGESKNSTGNLRSTDREWIVDEGPCGGDSGGPALDAHGRTIGVMSRGSATVCTTMIYQRIDVEAEWLTEAAREAATHAGIAVPDWGGASVESSGGSNASTADAASAAAPPSDNPSASEASGCAVGRPAASSSSLFAMIVAGVAAAFSRARRRGRGR